MLKFELIKPIAKDSKPSTFEVVVTTMQGDADNFHYLKLYDFKRDNANDMAWLETILRWGPMHEARGMKHHELEDHSIVQQIIFGDEIMDFEEIEKDIESGSIEPYKDWDILPKFFLDMTPKEKTEYIESIEGKYLYPAYGWDNPYSSYWQSDEYYRDAYYSSKIKFIDEDLVEWNVKFDIID